LGLLGDPSSWLDACAALDVRGVATHLACADTDDPADPSAMTHRQLAAFGKVLTVLRTRFPAALGHAANSAALLRFPSSHGQAVRPGLALYGSLDGHGLAAAMKLSTEVAQLRVVPSGHAVSYGATWRAARESRLAVLHVGYADGLPRLASHRAEVLLGGRRVPLVGTISMDRAVADVTDRGDKVAVGDPGVVFGGQGRESIPVAEVARWSGLIEYEVTCGVSKRVPRRYI
jgi:alanine racemase